MPRRPLSSPGTAVRSFLVVGVLATLPVACGSDAEPDSSSAPTTSVSPTTTSTSTTVTPTTIPTTYDGAVTARLTDEIGDAELAQRLVAGLDPAKLAALEQKVPMSEVATDPMLAYRPERGPAADISALVIYDFGIGAGPDGSQTPGPVNTELAQAAATFVTAHPMPIYAQELSAQVLGDLGVPDVTVIHAVNDANGQPVYLSTAGVAQQVAALVKAANLTGTVGVVGFADHAQRCVLTTRAAGMTAAVPDGLDLPTTYDPASKQEWTRDRATYLATDLTGRLGTL